MLVLFYLCDALTCLDLTRCDVNSPWLSLSVCGVQLLEILWLLHF